MFDTAKDANQKLASTVILLNEAPIYVIKAEEEIEAGGGTASKNIILKHYKLPLSDKKSEIYSCKLDESQVDFRTLGARLGYINTVTPNGEQQSSFVSRLAKRQSVQGINGSNLSFTPFYGPSYGHYPTFLKIYKDESFSDMLKGKYPTKSQAKKKVLESDEVYSMAFNRWFSFCKTKLGVFYLEYKGQDIGWSEDLDTINLGAAFSHLQETLEYYDIPFKLKSAGK